MYVKTVGSAVIDRYRTIDVEEVMMKTLYSGGTRAVGSWDKLISHKEDKVLNKAHSSASKAIH